MTEIPEKTEAQHQLFIQQVVESSMVWGLYCPDGWANADSCEFEDVVVYPFWSSADLAKICSVEEWKIYQPKSLELAEFLENWCVGMHKEYILPGVNWDEQMDGKELESLDLALQIVQELKRQGKELKFKLYKSQAEFEKMILDVVSSERH